MPNKGEPKRLADRGDDLIRHADRGERHECDTIGKGGGVSGRDRQRQARFADPTRPEQGEQATLRVGQQSGDRGQFGTAADERGRLVARARV